MANFGRRPITDATKPKPHLTYLWDGEERIDRRPQGRHVERFVDPQGNVVSLQLAGDGDPQRAVTVDRMRMQFRRDGFVEHARCPMLTGAVMTAGVTKRDYSAMMKDAALAEPCKHEMQRTLVKDGHEVHAKKSCPHIEWLIEARREKEKAQATKRNANRLALEERAKKREELELAQLELAKEQLEERKVRKKAAPKGD